MPLEQQIEILNANFATLISLLTSGEVPKAAGKKAAVKEQVTQPVANAGDASLLVVPPTGAPAALTSPAVTAEHITQAIIALCAKDKPACLAVLQKFGATRGGELKVEQHPDAYKQLHAEVTKHPDALEKLNAALAKLKKA